MLDDNFRFRTVIKIMTVWGLCEHIVKKINKSPSPNAKVKYSVALRIMEYTVQYIQRTCGSQWGYFLPEL